MSQASDQLRQSPLTEITDDCAALSRGAAILGSGGGGDPYIGRLLAESAVRDHGPVPVTALEEVPDDAVVVAVAMMGAPTVMLEKLPSAEQFAAAVRALAAYRHITPTHIVCIEIGGVNSTSPIVAAAELGLPVVDADGMGRAFPEIQMVLPTLYGYSAAPMSVADEKGNQLIVDTIDNTWAERLSRTAVVEMGCSAITAQYALSGAELKKSFVPGGLSLCIRLGTAIERARAKNRDPVVAVADVLGGRILGAGKVIDIERRTTAGFARGLAHIASTDGVGDIELSFQNEHLMVTRNGSVETTAPDLIIVLDTETGEPITTEALRYGQRVRVVTAPADPRWHSPRAHRLAGPEYFHYDSAPIRFDGTEAA
ncbi:MAG: DUF917 domain-containing protein [Microbacteriaceae bacterium]|jgi:DUF917 family protein|nr:DUF917 domain-containing protein [Microbacteriaceae bacterium]